MSKSRGNTADPWSAVADHGADALRWYFITVSNPWVPKRYDPEGVQEARRRFFDTLANTYRFFALYATTEGWHPSPQDPPAAQRGVLDRWLASRLNTLTALVGAELEAYQLTRAYRAVDEFVDELSNWYVRRSRSRFWGNADDADARAAFRSLWDALRTLALLLAPVIPFTADWLHRGLTGESVHLGAFPEGGDGADVELEAEMDAARSLVSLGRAAREEVQIRVRQPLRTVHAVVPGRGALRDEVLALVRDELNVKEIRFLSSADDLVHLVARPNFRALGPRFGAATNQAAEAVRALSDASLTRFRAGEEVHISLNGTEHTLERGDLEVVEEARGGLVVRSERGYTVALDPTLDDALRQEGLARELVNRVQRLRKDAGLEITDRIELGVFGPDAVRAAAHTWGGFVAGETLAEAVTVDEAGDEAQWEAWRETEMDGSPAVVALRRRRE
jgi:isoleucyl-tRNA synthetase